MQNFGCLSPNGVDADGDRVLIYTGKQQLFEIAPGEQQQEIGFAIGDKLLAGYSATASYVTIHRSGTDTGVFMSDGVGNVFFYSLNNNAWSPQYQIAGAGGVKALKSIETSPGNYTLMAGRNANGGYLLGRNLSTFSDDNGSTYSGFGTVGSIRLAQLGDKLTEVAAIAYERMPAGSDFTVSVLINDLGTNFVTIPQTTRWPYELTAIAPDLGAPSTNVVAWRHDLTGAQVQQPDVVTHMQVKISMANEAAKNELLGFAIMPPDQL
jgi:hypothetical protein